MTKEVADQISDLINSQNELISQYTAQKVLNQATDHLWESEGGRVLGVVRVQRVQWYQAEISHLSVQPDLGRSGVGSKLLKRAEERAVELGARITQCTIRTTNEPSINFFTKHGYSSAASFYYPYTGNTVMVFQRALSTQTID